MTLIEFSATLCLIVIMALGALLLHSRRRLSEARVTCAVIETVPLASFRWTGEQERAGKPGRASYAEFVNSLASGDAERLEAARLSLHRSGTPFSAKVAMRSGGAYVVEGRRAAIGQDVLWLVDASTAAIAQRASEEAAGLRAMLDAIPVPVWRRGPDFTLADCNRAYANALDTTRELALSEARQLVTKDNAQPGRRRHVVIGGSRRLIEVTELPCGISGSIGFALDRTDLETAEAELSRHIDAHAEVLEGIGAAVAIYGPTNGSNSSILPSPPSGVFRRIGSPRNLPSRRFWNGFGKLAASRKLAIFAPSNPSGCGCSPR